MPQKTTLSEHSPELAAQWHPTKNGGLAPEDVTPGSGRKVWWLCPDCGHEWEACVKSRTRGDYCPQCRKEKKRQSVIRKRGSFLSVYPELAAQWHPTKNGDVTPDQLPPKSACQSWWLGPCGHEWQTSVQSRANGYGCPYCGGRKLLPGFNDLASQNPRIADQWHPDKNGKLMPNEVSRCSSRLAWWLCPDCGHEWLRSVSERVHSPGCPNCGQSKRKPQSSPVKTK